MLQPTVLADILADGQGQWQTQGFQEHFSYHLTVPIHGIPEANCPANPSQRY